MTDLTLTEAAAEQTRILLHDINDPEIKGLRLLIQGGGCSGFKYVFQFANEVTEDDTVVETNGSRLFVDPLSAMYLDGAIVDFKTEIAGSQFVIKNPSNETSRCGCGSSFGA